MEIDAWAQRSGGKRKAFGQGATLANYIGTLPVGEVVIVHADYSPNGHYNLFVLRALSKVLCLSTPANMVVLVKKSFASSVFGVNFRGCVLAHVAMNQAMGVSDSLQITTTLLNREPPHSLSARRL